MRLAPVLIVILSIIYSIYQIESPFFFTILNMLVFCFQAPFEMAVPLYKRTLRLFPTFPAPCLWWFILKDA